MTNVPLTVIGKIGSKEVGFWKKYDKFEQFFVYELEELENGIIAKYIYDYATSIWFYNEAEFREFPSKYEVVSGGWYGEGRGRWRTSKRTFGQVTFEGVTNKKVRDLKDQLFLDSKTTNYKQI